MWYNSTTMEKMENEKAVTFNIDRKSSIASKLKSTISDKLIHFLGDFTDDVLAEYITVLVCNGKDQIQAKHDLEAFLGERSSAFISWLWDHMFRIAHDADKDLKSNRSSSAGRRSLTKNCKNSQRISRCSPNNRELSEYSEKSKKHVRANKEQSEKRRSVSREAVDMAEKHGGDRRAKSNDIHKNENEKAGVLNSDFLRRLKSLESSNAKKEEAPPERENKAANMPAENPLTTFPDVACDRKVRGSVWDRLGKPCEEKSTDNDNSLEPCGDQMKKHYQAQDQPKIVLPFQNENIDLNMEDRVHYLDKSSVDRKFEQKANTIVKPCSENNIRPKRTYSEINSNSTSLSASVDQHFVDGSLRERSSDSKKLNSSTEIKDVRQKLHEIEMEMSKLRSKQLGMSKGQPPVLLSSGASEVRDVNARTVFASNVHFAVTEKALSSHFAKCGLVSGVTFSNTMKGSAYITFSSKDSVEKALALSGTSFVSRPLKVVKKGEETLLTTSKPPLGVVKSLMHTQKPVPKTGTISLEKPFNPPTVHHSLQWLRDPISATSEQPSQA